MQISQAHRHALWIIRDVLIYIHANEEETTVMNASLFIFYLFFTTLNIQITMPRYIYIYIHIYIHIYAIQ